MKRLPHDAVRRSGEQSRRSTSLIGRWQDRGLSTATVHNYLSFLRTFAGWLGKHGMPRSGWTACKSKWCFATLVSNALGAAADAANPGASVMVQAIIRGERLVVSVQDTGDGVPVSHLHGLFESRPSTKAGCPQRSFVLDAPSLARTIASRRVRSDLSLGYERRLLGRTHHAKPARSL